MTRYHRYIVLLAACLSCNVAAGNPPAVPFLTVELDPASYSVSRSTGQGGFLGGTSVEDTITARAMGDNQEVPIGERTALELRFPSGTGLELRAYYELTFEVRIGDLDAPTTFVSRFSTSGNDHVAPKLNGVSFFLHASPLPYSYEALDEGQTRWIEFQSKPQDGIGVISGERPILRGVDFTFTLPDGPSLVNDPVLLANSVELTVKASLALYPEQVEDTPPLLSIVPEPASAFLLAVMGGSLLWRRKRLATSRRPGTRG